MTVSTPPVSATGVIHGEVITQRWVVEMILDLVGYTPNKDLTALRIAEPAAGTGAFLGPIIDRLIVSAGGTSAGDLGATLTGDCIKAYELQDKNVSLLREAVTTQLVRAGVSVGRAAVLATEWVVGSDYLSPERLADGEAVDFVVGNPPYIRLEDLGDTKWQQYRQVAPTMRGRADIYIAFFELGLRALKDGGKLGFICADRWMRNNYGRALRELIGSQGFSVEAIVTMHDAPAFETEVDAYPAITVIKRGQQGEVLIADTTESFTGEASRQLVGYAREMTDTALRTPHFSAARLTTWHPEGPNGWPHGAPDEILWLRAVADRWPTIEETGARISIGVATGADAVYVTDPRLPKPAVEEERLLPLAHADDIRSGEWQWRGRYLVNPWMADGLVDLDDYPQLRTYMNSHPRVKERNVARKNPKRWHRTIDRVNFDLLNRRLILLQDMSSAVNPVIAPAGFYPHHNLYFIDATSSDWTPEALAGLLLSDQVEAQVKAHCVLMRGKTLRLQAQYLRRVRVPHPNQLGPEILGQLEAAYKVRDRKSATELFAGCWSESAPIK